MGAKWKLETGGHPVKIKPEPIQERIKSLKKKRAVGFVVGVLGVLLAYFGFSTFNDANKELGRLDQMILK
jgi:hypothetical protein